MPETTAFNEDIIIETYEKLADIKKTAKEIGLTPRQVKKVLETNSVLVNEPEDTKAKVKRKPKKGQVSRYILTSAQNNTRVHLTFFRNLEAYANQIGAELLISRFTYNKAAFGAKSVKPGSEATEDDKEALWYDKPILPYVCDNRIKLAPDLVFCGEMNVLPTGKRPLSGLESYAGEFSTIFPHSKLAMESVASLTGAKLMYTTGTVTVSNYIQKKAGLQAEFHHAYAALIVEVDHKGNWWVRQLNGNKDGEFCDITDDGAYKIANKTMQPCEIDSIVYGDLHIAQIDPKIDEIAFGKGGILDTLQPRRQFCHDILDFQARNHHESRNPHSRYKRYVEGSDDVRKEVRDVVEFLQKIEREWCRTVIVDSNHDNALDRWLKEADYKTDPTNALFFLECQLAKYQAITKGDDDHHSFEQAALREDDSGVVKDCVFLTPNHTCVINGVEHGMHGHRGPNGARGNANNLSRMGTKSNIGHSHSARIVDGTYQGGTFSKLRMSYNEGPSSWTHSFIIQYDNGKRTIVTIRDGKWKA